MELFVIIITTSINIQGARLIQRWSSNIQNWSSKIGTRGQPIGNGDEITTVMELQSRSVTPDGTKEIQTTYIATKKGTITM